MDGHVGGVNEEVIHVNDKPSFHDHIVKRVIHEALESGGGIGETEEHYCRFKESFMGDEGSFPLISVFDSDIIISPSDIELGEDFCPLEFIDEVRNEGKGVCITVVEKVLCCFSFFGGKGVYFANLGFEGFIKVDLVVIGTRRRNMVCSFL